jgi:phosphatidylglycerol:prolipoprotein diacylglycerol transferase
VQPEIHILGITLQTFGLMLGIGFVVCGVLAARYLQEIGKPVDWAYEFVFAALIGGIVGARLWWVAENWDDAKGDLLGSLFSGSGLVFFGGALGGAIAVLAWSWRRGWLEGRTFDMAAAPLAAGYAIGRIGCQLAGDGDYGIPWDGPWAMAYPNGTVPTDVRVHPTPVYETIVMGLVALVLWRLRDRYRPGVLFAIWLVAAGIERFLIEFIRRNEPIALGLTLAQFISLGMVAAGGVWLARARSGAGLAAARG